MADKPKYLSKEGLLFFWTAIKNKLSLKADKEELTETAAAIRREFNEADDQLTEEITQAFEDLTEGLSTKEDTLQYGTATAEDVGKAMMPKMVAEGKVTSWEFGEAGKVDDVQIDGMSILENKVVNIPVADVNTLGVIKTSNSIGIVNGAIGIIPANSLSIKNGMSFENSLIPARQHESTFYGLAKAAGDTTQSSSSNAIGTYTNEAKTAIQSMLGVDKFNLSDRLAKGTGERAIKEGVLSGTLGTRASGNFSHAEGVGTKASGTDSHAEGYCTVASGKDSHAMGSFTIANHKAQFVFGEYNKEDESINESTARGEYIEIVGNGVNNTRSNARTLDWNGNEVLAGKLTVGAAPTDIMDVSTKGYVDTAIADAVGDITSFEFQVVTELPVTGTKGIIYLRAHSHGDNDVYDEYIWVTDRYERLGTLDVDLSGYATIQYVDDELSTKIDDVGINGTSIVNNGIANIPVADSETFGVVKAGAGSTGIQMSNGYLTIVPAAAQTIKIAPNATLAPIIPSTQHQAVFYGLAKAAGDTTQSLSDNVVGTYTDEAKSAIKTMLDIPTKTSDLTNDSDYTTTTYVDNEIDTLEAAIPTNNNQLTNGAGYQTESDVKAVVADSFQDGIEITVSGTTPAITANANTRYVCGEVTSLTFTPPAEGVTEVIFTAGDTVPTLTLPATVKMPEWFTIESGYTYAISIENATYGSVASWQT